ncbi:MAG TPA: MFS transporter [Candidatus Tumulicola sp.]|nr:MFS transporter [Candidatus Tumulicola sp.]
MPESRYEVLALFAAAMVAASLFVVATGTLTPFLTTAFHLGQAQAGLVLSVQMVGSLLATAVAGALTDRFGDKAVVLWSGWFMGIALLCAGAVANFHWILGWLMIYGIGFAAVTPAGSHAIVFFFKKEDRGFAMGVRQCGVPLAGVAGSILLPAVALHFGYRWSLATAGVVTIVTCTLASMLYREPRELAGERVSLRAMFAEMLQVARDAHLILITLTSMTLVCAQMVLLGFLTITLVHQASFGLTAAVGAFTVSQVAAMAGRIGWGWASDTIFGGSRALPLAVASVVSAAAAFAAASLSAQTQPWEVYALAAVLGFAAEGWFGVSVIAIAEIGGEEHSGSALGVALTAIFFAAFASPTIFGAVVESRGYPFAWESLSLLVAAGIVPALLATGMARRLVAR